MSYRPTRRNLLKQLTALGASSAFGACRYETRTDLCWTDVPATDRPPSFVIFLTDDQASTALGRSGRFPFMSTPNMDRLADEGGDFRNTFVTTALCSPSRASLLTGTYAHRHGVLDNGINDYDPSLPTLQERLQEAGYTTAFIGKWHMRPDAEPRPGFDYWLGFAGQGRYWDPDLNENGVTFRAQGYLTDLITDYAVRWLERQSDEPFCLFISHKAAHGPYKPAVRHRQAFADAEFPEPVSWSDDYGGKPEWQRRALIYGIVRGQWERGEGEIIPDTIDPVIWDPTVPSRLDYLRCLLSVDDGIGRVLDTLESLGRLDETMVIHTSDNGLFLGEHRLTGKGLAYEEAIRVPLMIRYPHLISPGSTFDQMVLNIDLMPTILDLAGADLPSTLHGHSIRSILLCSDNPWRESFLYEYFQVPWVTGVPNIQAVRTGRYKLVHYPDLIGDIDELYDLQEDPYEVVNLIEDPIQRPRAIELRNELYRLLPV